jgi:predicted acyltransferase
VSPAERQLRTPISSRIEGLDAFRGATVAAMLLVNNPGTWKAVWWPLQHAEWHGWTPTDLIFPFFLFVVGVTTELSRKESWPILKRGLLIILFGLLLNAFPFFWWGKMDPGATFLDRVVWRFEHLRYMGVLQRIGIVYVIGAFIARALEMSSAQLPKDRIEASAMRRLGDPRIPIFSIVVAILLVYWLALGFGELEPPGVTVAAQIDRLLLGENHIWSSSKTWTPRAVVDDSRGRHGAPGNRDRAMGPCREGQTVDDRRRVRHRRGMAVGTRLPDQQRTLDEAPTSSSPPASPVFSSRSSSGSWT